MKNSNLCKKDLHCQNCPINQLCLAATLDSDELSLLDNIVEHPKALQKSETLFYAGEELSYVYAIRSGSIKTFSISRDGEEQITGFHQAGDLIGIDALANNRHKSFAKALEPTEICAIPFEKLEALAMSIPKIHHQLMAVMSNEISKHYDLMLTLNQRSADQRLAAFLLNMYKKSEDYKSRPEISLNMTRAELGNYLGLALETVSRLMSRFKKDHLIELDHREVKIVDLPKLKQVAGMEDQKEASEKLHEKLAA